MTTNKIRIGFVGVGNMGQAAHLRNYASISECEVVAIAELREQTARQVAQRYNVPHVYLDHNEMLEKQHLDGIVCPQLFWRHGVIVPEVLKAGVPVLTEKPLAASIEVGEKIVQAAKDNGGLDNVSAIVVRVDDPAAVPAAPPWWRRLFAWLR